MLGHPVHSSGAVLVQLALLTNSVFGGKHPGDYDLAKSEYSTLRPPAVHHSMNYGRKWEVVSYNSASLPALLHPGWNLIQYMLGRLFGRYVTVVAFSCWLPPSFSIQISLETPMPRLPARTLASSRNIQCYAHCIFLHECWLCTCRKLTDPLSTLKHIVNSLSIRLNSSEYWPSCPSKYLIGYENEK